MKMNDNVLTGFGTLIALTASLVALVVVFAILRLLVRLTAGAVSQTLRAVSRLLFDVVTDIRLLTSMAVIFCLIADRRDDREWVLIAMVVSNAAFFMSLCYIGIFLLAGSWLNSLRDSSGNAVRFSPPAEAFLQQLRLNVAFLGLFLLALTFSCSCYSSHLAATRTRIMPQQFDAPAGQANFAGFFTFTAHMMVDSLPDWMDTWKPRQISDIRIADTARPMQLCATVFRLACWASLAALFSGLFFPRRSLPGI
jgi:hypothetical protein